MPEAARLMAFRWSLPVIRRGYLVTSVSIGAGFQKADQAFAGFGMSGTES